MIVFDFDGVISECVHGGVFYIFREMFRNGVSVAIVTARREEHRQSILDSLSRNGIQFPPEMIFMRRQDENCSDADVKRRIMQEIGIGNITLVFEDTPDVIAAWRQAEVPCVTVQNFLIK